MPTLEIMGKSKNWYVLFIRTGREDKVEIILKKCLDPSAYLPFIPKQESLFKISGIIKKEIKPLFPGYIFIESAVTDTEFLDEIRKILYLSKDVYSILQYRGSNEIAMHEHERTSLLSLYNDNLCVEYSSGVIVGDNVYIEKGPLMGFESKIKKIDRHRRQASVEIVFMGEPRQIKVALEITKKT